MAIKKIDRSRLTNSCSQKHTHAHTHRYQIDSTSSCSDRMRLIATSNIRVNRTAAVPGRSLLGERRQGRSPDQHSSSNRDEEDREVVRMSGHRWSAGSLFHTGEAGAARLHCFHTHTLMRNILNGGCWAHTRITLQGLRHLNLSKRCQQETQTQQEVPYKWLQMCQQCEGGATLLELRETFQLEKKGTAFA